MIMIPFLTHCHHISNPFPQISARLPPSANSIRDFYSGGQSLSKNLKI